MTLVDFVFIAHSIFRVMSLIVELSHSHHIYLLWFPLGLSHLALLLSKVVIYKHQFVSAVLLSASLTSQLVNIKTCVTMCMCAFVF